MTLSHVVYLLVVQNSFADTIWNTGIKLGYLPEVNISDLSPRSFFDKYQRVPFVFRSFQDSLSTLADSQHFSDSIEWLRMKLGDDSTADSVEGELHETRLAPTIRKVKWKYFLEKFKKMDIYAVTQAPEALRTYLKLMPVISCGGIHDRMVAPHIWVSGGVRSSRSVVHMDSYANQHCILKGHKRFLLIPPNAPITTREYGWVETDTDDKPEGFENAYGAFFGEVDTENMDLDRFPKWKDVPWFEADLREGDCLYMPEGWFHYVESEPEITVSWHQWFNIPEKWREEDSCDKSETVKFTTAQCVYSNDKHRPNKRQTIDWSSYDDRKSVCYTQ